MATKKDLVEAYSFSRRRLVTAFVSGAPGGREVEPTRPGRAIIGGLALAVLLVAGGAVLGIIKSPSTYTFEDEALVSEKESGADYLVLKRADDPSETELRPLANITSAMLIFGSTVESQDVSRDRLSEEQRGAPIGILGAPATPPEGDSLVQTGWTACTGLTQGGEPTGIKVDLSEDPAVTLNPEQMFVVKTADSGMVYVVAQAQAPGDRAPRAYAYAVPVEDGRQALLGKVAQDTAPTVVPDRWIGLFPPGGALDLETFGLPTGVYGTPYAGAAALGAANAKNGSLIRVGGTLYLLTPGTIVQLDDFSSVVYGFLAKPRGKQLPTLEADQLSDAQVTTISELDGVRWPTQAQVVPPPAGELCGVLDVGREQPGVVIGTADEDGTEVSSEGIDVEATIVSVDSGHGAFVFSGDWEKDGPSIPFLVDDRGYGYPVGLGAEQELLGFGGEDFVEVPVSWMDLLSTGVPLTIDAARCPPTSDDRSGCS